MGSDKDEDAEAVAGQVTLYRYDKTGRYLGYKALTPAEAAAWVKERAAERERWLASLPEGAVLPQPYVVTYTYDRLPLRRPPVRDEPDADAG